MKRCRAPLFAFALSLFASTVGCSANVEAGEETEDELYSVPTEARVGEQRDVLLSEMPALSRDPASRARGERDAVIATWHVHHVSTDDGYAGVLVYGADTANMVRLAVVIDDGATSVSIVEPSNDEMIEPSPDRMSRAPLQALEAEDRGWLASELQRLGSQIPIGASGGIQPQTFQMSPKCAARIATQVLAFASLIVLTPAGGFVVNAIEAFAWGDFESAAVAAGVSGSAALGSTLSQSERTAIRRTGAVLKVTAKAAPVALGALAAAFLIKDPSAAAEVLAPPQCQAPTP